MPILLLLVLLLATLSSRRLTSHNLPNFLSHNQVSKAYITNLNAPNWFYGVTDQQKYSEAIAMKNKTANLTVCDISTPYAIGFAQCVACPPGFQLFDLGTQKCSPCPDGFIFNSSLSQCTNKITGSSLRTPSSSVSTTTTVSSNLTAKDNLTTTNKTTKESINTNTSLSTSSTNTSNTTFVNTIKTPANTQNKTNTTTIQKINTTTQTNNELALNGTVESPTFNFNNSAKNYIGDAPQYNESKPTCTRSSPYPYKNSCISCPAPQVFDFKSSACVACPSGTVFGMHAYKCVTPSNKKASRFSIDPAVNTNYDWITQQSLEIVFNEAAKNASNNIGNYCEQKTPFFNGVECFNCEGLDLRAVFDAEKAKCVRYNDSLLVYSPNTKSLVSKSLKRLNSTNPRASNLILESADKKPNQTLGVCPLTAPYLDDLSCIKCQKPFELFQLASRRCTRCPNGTLYEPVYYKCVQNSTILYTNFNARNILIRDPTKSIEDYKKQLDSFRRSKSSCNDTHPYFDGTKCINCSASTPLFDIDAKTCTVCQKSFSSFFDSTHNCTDNIMITNLDANHILISPPSYTLATEKAESKALEASQSNRRVANCSLDKPYVVNGTCSTCPEDLPLYSLKDKNCTKCEGTDMSYFPDDRVCKKGKWITAPGTGKILTNTSDPYISTYNKITLGAPEGTYISCPTEKPYFNGLICIQCKVPNDVFDTTSKKCTRCKDSERYNQNSQKCEKYDLGLSAPLQRIMMNLH